MPKYLLAYHGGTMPSSPEEGQKVMKAWTDWIVGLGKAMIDPGNPTGPARTLSPGNKVGEGGGAGAISGYSILEAASLDDALRLCEGCPQLSANGSIEIAEIVPVM